MDNIIFDLSDVDEESIRLYFNAPVEVLHKYFPREISHNALFAKICVEIPPNCDLALADVGIAEVTLLNYKFHYEWDDLNISIDQIKQLLEKINVKETCK